MGATDTESHSVKLSRRTLLRSGAAHLLFPPPPSIPLGYHRGRHAAKADDKVWRHGLSLFGDLKYPAGFKHFDYVNPNAPKGGVVRLGGFGTFDNFNIVIRGVKGTIAAGIDLIYERLMIARARTRSRPNTGSSPRRSAIRRISPRSPIGCAPRRMA